MRTHLRTASAVAVAIGGVVIGLSSPALGVAAKHLISGSTIKEHSITGNRLKSGTLTSSQIKKHSISGDRLKANTVTGSQIKESTLGIVPLAAAAEYAPPATVLPAGHSEVGTWETSESSGFASTGTISFPIPLTAAPTFHVIDEDENPAQSDPTGCSGTAAAPVAAPGNLCIFIASHYGSGTISGAGVINPLTGDEGSATRFGTTVFAASGNANVIAGGTWAVTA
jgi:hypothetical protein